MVPHLRRELSVTLLTRRRYSCRFSSEKEIPIDLLCTKGPRDVTSYRDPRNPKVTRKSSAEHIHGRMSSLEELFRKRRVCDDVREVRRSEPFDVAGAEIPKNVVKAGRRFAANDVA